MLSREVIFLEDSLPLLPTSQESHQLLDRTLMVCFGSSLNSPLCCLGVLVFSTDLHRHNLGAEGDCRERIFNTCKVCGWGRERERQSWKNEHGGKEKCGEEGDDNGCDKNEKQLRKERIDEDGDNNVKNNNNKRKKRRR